MRDRLKFKGTDLETAQMQAILFRQGCKWATNPTVSRSDVHFGLIVFNGFIVKARCASEFNNAPVREYKLSEYEEKMGAYENL